LTIARQFQSGARAFRSEVVGNLKKDALSIFQITDIPSDQFLDADARAESAQLAALREDNEFLYATKEAMPDSLRIERYLRSESLIRVSCIFQFQS